MKRSMNVSVPRLPTLFYFAALGLLAWSGDMGEIGVTTESGGSLGVDASGGSHTGPIFESGGSGPIDGAVGALSGTGGALTGAGGETVALDPVDCNPIS